MATIDFYFDDDDLKGAMHASDDVGAITRTHFLVEAAARRALSMRDKSEGELPNFAYLTDVLRTLRVLGFRSAVIEPAEAINSIRNKFIHKFTRRSAPEIDAEIVNRLQVMVGAYYPLIMKPNYLIKRRDRVSDEEVSSDLFSDLNPRRKFAVLGIHVAETLVVEAQYPGWKHDGEQFRMQKE